MVERKISKILTDYLNKRPEHFGSIRPGSTLFLTRSLKLFFEFELVLKHQFLASMKKGQFSGSNFAKALACLNLYKFGFIRFH